MIISRRSVMLGAGAVGAGAALGLEVPAAPVEERPAEWRPVLFTTEAKVRRARRRVDQRLAPFHGAWLRTKDAADAALGRTYVPEQLAHHEAWFSLAKSHAQDVRSLALAYRITDEERYADKAREILRLWAADALEAPYPGQQEPHSAGLVLGRVLPIFADGHALVWDETPPGERDLIRRWFAHMITPIRRSLEIWESGTITEPVRYEPPWLDRQYFNNHLGAQNLGFLAIGLATGDHRLVQEAVQHPENPRDLKELIDGVIIMPRDFGSGGPGDVWWKDVTLTQGAPAPEAGEIWDRYRTAAGKGLHYAHIHFRFLVLQAELLKNNRLGRDWFAYTGPNGENLELPFTFYSEFLLTGNSNARTGYYWRSSVDYGLLPLYEIAHREYPGNADVRRLLESFDRVAFDSQTFGWTLLLTDGEDDLAIAPHPYPSRDETSWTFDRDDDLENWTIRNAQVTVRDGALHVAITRSDPGIVSPDLLGLSSSEYRAVEITVRNHTTDPQVQVFFISDDDPTYSASKSVTATMSTGDSDFHTYRIDLGGNPGWTGRIRQLRIDPGTGLEPGTVSFDSVRFV
ncbi:alginate lyase family protein [Microlunatus parietis]|uniref:Alginate lyase domain-containing protein n=1 Tax=Microlunatus parietis TaxID=682979 RepID=A0A7Y9I3H4_9ACTN|nr:alginate lyase family protein [Microlunatus parietis]NYE69306.1 hypothetical protein [Microlunatus parietis]